MQKKQRRLFLLFGILSVIVMFFTFDMEYEQLLKSLQQAGYYLPLVLLLWGGVYFINTISWNLIIGKKDQQHVPFWKLYKYTISGFALNTVTPVGLMGGEPYRILETKAYIGTERATSSVLLYVMMHISSHFCLWFFSAILYFILFDIEIITATILILLILFCLLAFYLFIRGYRYGIACSFMKIAQQIPFLKRRIKQFTEKHQEQLDLIDKQIIGLHKKNKKIFYTTLTLELFARIVSCVEVWLIMNTLTTNVLFTNSIFIVAFSSLIANLLFFLPMQLGGREGGFALAVGGLSISGAFGLYTALITRVRELVWTVIGIILIQVGTTKGTKGELEPRKRDFNHG